MKKESKNQAEVELDPRDVKITELTNDLQRTRADFENYRKHWRRKSEEGSGSH